MENKKLIATAEVSINAPLERVWDALVNPAAIKQYMFGTTVITDWREGGSIIWKGEWQGKAYEDRGKILQVKPGKVLQYSHFSPLAGQPDTPENHHTVTVKLSRVENFTQVALTQDNNSTDEARQHSEKNWGIALTAMKKFLES